MVTESIEYGDIIDIFVNAEGIMVARATCGPISVEEPLPLGFGEWSQEEMAAHFRRFVAPKLKTKMVRFKEIAVGKYTDDQVKAVGEELAKLDEDTRKPADVIKINRAVEKRVIRRKKRGGDGPQSA